jgi:uncharacterized protein (DUF885 family)
MADPRFDAPIPSAEFRSMMPTFRSLPEAFSALPARRPKHLFLAAFTVFFFALAAMPSCSTPAAKGPSPEAKSLDSLYEAYRDYCMRNYPTWATYEGDHRFNTRMTDWSVQGFARRLDSLKRFRRVVLAVDTLSLNPEQRLNQRLFVREMDMAIEGAAFHPEYLPFNQLGGPHLSLPQLIDAQPLETPGDYEAYFTRLRGIPQLMAQCEEQMKYGISYGVLPPRFVAEQVAAQMRDIGGRSMGNSPFSQPLRESEAEMGQYYPDLYSALKRILEEDVHPAYLNMAAFIEQNWVPIARDEPGLHALSDGAGRYAYAVRYHTTTELSPEAIFAIGEQEVAEIQGQMEALMQEIGFEGDLQGFMAFLRSDSQFYYSDPDPMMAEYRRILDQADAALPALFGTLPQAPYALKEMESYRAANAPQAYYSSAPEDRSRPGYFYVNTAQLDARPKYTMTALALHEAVPGHHLQIAIAQELGELPWFRRNLSATAYVEGWALYAERLGYAMGEGEYGLYTDPYQRFGALTFAMWRACRLVVDVGLHHKGWSRQEALNYMLARTPNSEADIRSEVDRYIATPGQALAYKIGERKILALRAEAEAALGEAFELREFHDAVLESGPLPLELLEQKMRAWIAERGGGPA